MVMASNGEIDWESWEPANPIEMTSVIDQLKIEVGPSHQIYHVLDSATIFARDGASDDVLVSNPNDPSTVFIVHPTWSRAVEPNNHFPGTIKIATASVPSSLLRHFGN